MNRFPMPAALAIFCLLAVALGAAPAQYPYCPAPAYAAPPAIPYAGATYAFGRSGYASNYSSYYGPTYSSFYYPQYAVPVPSNPRYYNPGPYYYTPAYSYTPGYYSYYYTPGYFRY
jgi:hypothetical protein